MQIRPLKKMDKAEATSAISRGLLIQPQFSHSDFWKSHDGLIVMWHAHAVHIAWSAIVDETCEEWEMASDEVRSHVRRTVEKVSVGKHETLRDLVKALEKGPNQKHVHKVRPLRAGMHKHNKEGGWNSACGCFYFHKEKIKNPDGSFMKTGEWKLNINAINVRKAELGQWLGQDEKSKQEEFSLVQQWRDDLWAAGLMFSARTRDELAERLEEYLAKKWVAGPAKTFVEHEPLGHKEDPAAQEQLG